MSLTVNDLRLIRSIVREEIDPLRLDVTELKGDVAELKKDVAVLKSDVAGLKKDVAVLKTDVGLLKKGQKKIIAEVHFIRESLNATIGHFDHCELDLTKRMLRVETDLGLAN